MVVADFVVDIKTDVVGWVVGIIVVIANVDCTGEVWVVAAMVVAACILVIWVVAGFVVVG